MACKNVCKLCNRIRISTAVAFTDGNLVVTLPAGSYEDGEKYCIVVAQTIPTTTTINAPVVIQIGEGTEQYPLLRRDSSQATACNINTRTRYATRVQTNMTSGTFRLLGCTGCCPDSNNLASIDGTAPTT